MAKSAASYGLAVLFLGAVCIYCLYLSFSEEQTSGWQTFFAVLSGLIGVATVITALYYFFGQESSEMEKIERISPRKSILKKSSPTIHFRSTCLDSLADGKNTPIFFNKSSQPCYEFSNTAEGFPITVDGVVYPSTNHYYHAMKFTTLPNLMERVRKSKDPAKLAKENEDNVDDDFPDRRDDVMKEALFAKFTQHPELKKILVGTGNRLLVLETSRDEYWGIGSSGRGENKLGLFLGSLRRRLR